MNEACSAGTGSFIEEQGRKFPGIRDVVHLAEEAMAADEGVSLGQHCSVFMAEVIDEAVSAGTERNAIITGLYDSIIQNVLNSNVPAILREQGAIGIPLDCYRVDAETPSFDAMYWAYGQRILRASHQRGKTRTQLAGPDASALLFS